MKDSGYSNPPGLVFGLEAHRATHFPAQRVHELVARVIGERRERSGLDGIVLTVVLHVSTIATFRDFATWQLLDQRRQRPGRWDWALSETPSLGKGQITDMKIYFPGGKRAHVDGQLLRWAPRAVVNAMSLSAVKKHRHQPPSFEITTVAG